MKTISLCMIVKNEENVIDNCLKSVCDIVDEIIIVDTGSTDKTKEICEKYTNKIYDFEWDYDFSKARNYSFSKATCDYILWLDADDVFKDIDNKKLKKLKNEMDGSVDVYDLIYNYRHDENGQCIYSFPRQRIVRNCKESYWTCIVHELLNVPSGKSEYTDIVVTHTNNHDNSKKYINFFETKILQGHILSSREKFYYAGELVMSSFEDKAIIILEEFVSDESYNNIYELSRGYNYLGMIYQDKGQYRKAIKNYLSQIAYSEPDMETFYNIASCYKNIGDNFNAIFYYEALLNLNFRKEKFINGSEIDITLLEKTINQFKIDSLLSLCVIYYDMGNVESAICCNDNVLLLDQNNESALYNKLFFIKLLKEVN